MMLKEALHVFCPVLHIFWRERGEPNKPPSQERRLCSHSKATLSENENHLVTTPRLHWWSATAEAKQHIQRWAVMFSLFFFFSQSVKLCQLFYFKFFPTKLKNFWIASQLSFSIERHVSFQLSFQGLWFIFARVISNETCFTYCLQCCLLMQREDCSNICNRFHLCICKPCVKMWNTKKARWACWGLTW